MVLTDLGQDAKEFVAAQGLEWDGLLYVALTRAKYRCVVLREDHAQKASSAGLSAGSANGTAQPSVTQP